MLSVAFSIVSIIAVGQTGSEIYLFDISLGKNKIAVSNPINVTNHPGYDNQPFFHRSKPLLYYSSFNDDNRSDIKVYNYLTRETKSFTTTSEREYSPTLTPDEKFISCIIQRDNNAQDLGQYPIDGGEAILLIDSLIIGYHAWVNENDLILFVLGDTMTLQWYNLSNQSRKVLDTNIGRSLHKIPNQKAMSYVKKKTGEEWIINRLDADTKKISRITTTLSGREDLTWTSDGKIIMSDGERLFFYDSKLKGGWKEVSMGESTLTGITRLAITNDGKKLAVVVSEN